MIYIVFVCAFLAGLLIGIRLTVRVMENIIFSEIENLKEETDV